MRIVIICLSLASYGNVDEQESASARASHRTIQQKAAMKGMIQGHNPSCTKEKIYEWQGLFFSILFRGLNFGYFD